jgi:hypothetical protein
MIPFQHINTTLSLGTYQSGTPFGRLLEIEAFLEAPEAVALRTTPLRITHGGKGGWVYTNRTLSSPSSAVLSALPAPRVSAFQCCRSAASCPAGTLVAPPDVDLRPASRVDAPAAAARGTRNARASR